MRNLLILCVVSVFLFLECNERPITWNLPRDNQLDGQSSSGQIIPNADAPVVSTLSISSLTSRDCVIEGDIESVGSSNVSSYGHCWSLSNNPTITDFRTDNGSTNTPRTYESKLTQLKPETKYFVRAFATNSSGTSYGETKEFTTEQNFELAIVSTRDIQNVTRTSASVGGNVQSNGGLTVSSRGVCYAVTNNPNLSDKVVNAGNGTGSFELRLTDLSPGIKYFVRAFATNSKGTAFGNSKSFTTLDLPNQTCNLNTRTTGSDYEIQVSNSGYYKSGQTIELTMYSSIYAFGQAEEVLLYDHENYVHSFGKWLYFPNNKKTLTIPQSMQSSNCYNLRVKKGTDLYVSRTFTIID